MQISNYSNDMDILGPFIKDEKHNGEDIQQDLKERTSN